ncbi:MAG: hypothetical protein ACOZBW_01110, partial [Thermodesulfobacteriota bacterium]
MTSSDKVKTPFPAASILTAVSFFIIAGASALMFLAARGDLWHDEIWSILFAESATTPLELFFFNHDNNHLLNTFFLYLVGNQRHLIVYRLFSVLSGIGSLLLVGHIAQKLWGNLEKLLALVLCGLSFQLILMFSEARGYAPAILFSLLAFACLLSIAASLKPLPLVLFWVACGLGILAHATFFIVYLAIFVYSLPRLPHEFQEKKSHHSQATRLLFVYGPPTIFMAGLYLWFFAPVIIGGGPAAPKGRTAIQSISLPFGQIWEPGMAIFTGIVTILMIVSGLYLIHRQNNRLWYFFATALIAAPILLVAVTRPPYFSPRYFTICLPFFYLLAARLLSTFFTGNNLRRWAAAAFVAVFIAGNMQQTIPLVIKGRGHYKDALDAIMKYSKENRITVSGDDYYTIMRLILFYSRFLPSSPEIRYIKPSDWKRQKPDWIILHAQGPKEKPLPLIVMPDIGCYRLFGEYRYCGYGSGWHWFVYQKDTEQIKQ